MLKRADIEEFYSEVEKQGLKYPVASIAKATGESKGNVSKILSHKMEPSEGFLNRFYEKFPKSSKNVSHETPGSALINLSECNKILASANKTLADAHIIIARNNDELVQLFKLSLVPASKVSDGSAGLNVEAKEMIDILSSFDTESMKVVADLILKLRNKQMGKIVSKRS